MLIKQTIDRYIAVDASSIEEAYEYVRSEGPWSADLYEQMISESVTIVALDENGKEIGKKMTKFKSLENSVTLYEAET